MVLDWIIGFAIGLLIGALGIYVGARAIVDVDDYTYAIITALIGAIGWAIIGWIPLLGAIVAFLVYLGIINWRYPGGWIDALFITLVAWVAVVIVQVILGFLGIGGFSAIGVPT